MPDDTFDGFFRRDYVPLVAFLRKLGFSREAAEDAAEDAMIEVYEKWHVVKNPRAYVRTAAHHAAGGHAKRDRARLSRSVAGGWLPQSGDDTLEHAEIEEQELVVSLLACLPRKRREVMAWYLDGFSTAEISEEMGISPETVRSHLRHARGVLKEKYECIKLGEGGSTRGCSTVEPAVKEVPQNGSHR